MNVPARLYSILPYRFFGTWRVAPGSPGLISESVPCISRRYPASRATIETNALYTILELGWLWWVACNGNNGCIQQE